jgi:hypothetical protein
VCMTDREDVAYINTYIYYIYIYIERERERERLDIYREIEMRKRKRGCFRGGTCSWGERQRLIAHVSWLYLPQSHSLCLFLSLLFSVSLLETRPECSRAQKCRTRPD